MTTTLETAEYLDWFRTLDKASQKAVAKEVAYLQRFGVRLGYPHSSAVVGSRYSLRELRATAGRLELRAFYLFDPLRQAVLLIGGCKSGTSEPRFYRQMIRRAEKIWERYATLG